MPLTNYADVRDIRRGDLVAFDGERKTLHGVIVRKLARDTVNFEVLAEDGNVYDVHWLTLAHLNPKRTLGELLRRPVQYKYSMQGSCAEARRAK